MTPRQHYIARSVIGGAAASLVMDVTQYAWALALERNRPSEDQDEETEAITSVVAYLTRFAPHIFRQAHAPALGRAIHYVFGVGFAAAYFRVLPNRRPAYPRGAIFGMLLWLVSDRILIPTFKLGRPWSKYSPAERANALASHLVYALVVEYSRPALNEGA